MPVMKLSKEDRRRIVIEVLGGDTKPNVAARHGISRQMVHKLVKDAIRDPETSLIEAQEEAAFRDKVRRHIHYKDK